MKKYLCIVFILFIFLINVFNVIKVSAVLPLSGKIIVIDPGHGGKDPGTSHGEILEKNINLKIALFLEEELSKRGASVILTREGDYDLSNANAKWRKKSDFDNRLKIINDPDVNLYLSIHLNYLTQAEYSGPQVFYNKDNKDLAMHIQNLLNTDLNSNREVKKIPTNTYMYNKINSSGVLVECGFLSNYNERKKLNTKKYQRKIASLLAEAISTYY